MNLFWTPTGASMKYDEGMLCVWNLNPSVKTGWRMSRMQMLALGWRCIVAACRR